MRIAMVSEHASPLAALGGVDAGGQNVHVAALSSALARAGHTVTVFTRRDDPDLPHTVQAAPGVEVVHVDAGPPRHVPKDDLLPHIPALGTGIARHWDEHGAPDVVHGHFWMSGLAALDAASQADQHVPVLQTFHALGSVKRRHQGAADTSPAEREWLEPWVGRSVDAVVATCTDEVFELRSLGVPAHAISVVPCGVDSDAFTPDGPSEPRGAAHRILSVGRLVPRKGVGNVVSALALLREQGREDVELVVVGGDGDSGPDPEVRRLRDLADSLGVGDLVELRGQVPQDQLPPILRSADAVVCAPWYEPFGIVPLEAMACGVPVVVATVGGLVDTVVDGATGLHVPPRDPASIAAALDRLLDDPDLRASLGAAGRERARGRYAWDRVAGATAKIYQQVVAAGDASGRARATAGPATRRTRGAAR